MNVMRIAILGVAAMKPALPARTILASVIGWPATKGERTTAPSTALLMSDCLSLVMSVLDTALFGHESQRTKSTLKI